MDQFTSICDQTKAKLITNPFYTQTPTEMLRVCDNLYQ